MNCRVCASPSYFFYKNTRTFYKCPNCTLIFTQELIEKKESEEHYRKQWSATDLNFWGEQLDVLFTIVQKYLKPKNILDFGSGSGGITNELQKRGYAVTPLDPMLNGYLKDQNYGKEFDLIVGFEVIEHLPNIYEELEEMERVLEPGGILIFTTLLTNPFVNSIDSAMNFQNWWYKDDLTHLSFFSNASLFALGREKGYKVDIYGDKVVVFSRQADIKMQDSVLLK